MGKNQHEGVPLKVLLTLTGYFNIHITCHNSQPLIITEYEQEMYLKNNVKS